MRSKGVSWRYKPKVNRSWPEEEAERPEQPMEQGDDATTAATIEPPLSARVEIEQLSERVRNLGKTPDAPAQEFVPEIKSESEVLIPANEPEFALPVIAAEPVFTPPTAAVFTPHLEVEYAKPKIPVQPAFKPNIPAMPPTQRIAERLAQQRSEKAKPQVPPVEPPRATPVSVSRPFYPESYVAPVTPSTTAAWPAFLEVQNAPRSAAEPRPPVAPPPSEAVAPPPTPPIPKPVVEDFVAPEVPLTPTAVEPPVAQEEKLTAPVPPPPPASFRPEIPIVPKFEPALKPRFEEMAQPTPEAAPKTKFEEPVPHWVEEPRRTSAAQRTRFEPTAEPPSEAPRQAAPQREEAPRPKQAPQQPAPRREASGESSSGLTRVLNAVRSAIPVVQRLLPLFEGNVAKAVTNLLALAPTTAIAPVTEKVDLAPVERGLLELHRQHHELREQLVTQNVSLKRVEDQLAQVRTATDRNTLEQQELIEEMQTMAKRQSRFATIMLILLLLSLVANALLYLQFRH